MRVGVPREVLPGERRVALVPATVGLLLKAGVEVVVEKDAGASAFISDDAYREAGASVVDDAAGLWGEADVVLKVQKPGDASGAQDETALLRAGTTVIGLLQPLTSPDLVKTLAERGVTSFSMDAIPRIARAQKMDALTSMATIAGYKAVLIASGSLGKLFPMMMTAAQTIPPARGLILGAGVAGLQAIATARRLGATMQAFDVRPAVKEQVESLGAAFVGAEAQDEAAEDARGYAKELSQQARERGQAVVHDLVRDVDFVITTALVPGRPAPLLIPEEMVRDMRPGSVIVDIAAETGGNCALTVPGETVERHGVTIHGPLNLPSSMPIHASQMYARNISGLLLHLLQDGQLHLDFEDVITRDCCITHEGEIVHGPTKALVAGD